ncbi:MAG: aminotransferase class III-fold pyridoxal phosphate-dependent enzyme [Thermoanaerobaculia bacterium]
MATWGYPDGALFYRRLDRRIPMAVGADGSYLIDADGKRYLDAAGGAVVANLGHSLPEIAEAVAAEIRSLGYVNGTQMTCRAAEELAAELARVLPGELRYSYFLASGSEAVEAAVKLARQVQLERGRPGRWKVISRVPSYHGNTLTALSLSGREHYRKVFAPLLTDFPRIPAPDPYRRPDDPRTTGELVEEEILRQGPESVAAFLCEPIVGASAGAVVPPREYYERAAEACRRHGVLLIADEVLTGMGRTGRWFASEHFDLAPDLLVFGKGVNAGAVPLSGLAATPAIVETLAAGSGYFNHAQTYSHHPATCAAGLAVVRHLRRERLVERCAELETAFFAALRPLAEHPWVGDVRGKGFLAGVELVADRATREPWPRERRLAERWTEAAFARGLIVWPNVGHVDGERGDLILLAPPLTASLDELAEIGRLLRRSLEDIS